MAHSGRNAVYARVVVRWQRSDYGVLVQPSIACGHALGLPDLWDGVGCLTDV